MTEHDGAEEHQRPEQEAAGAADEAGGSAGTQSPGAAFNDVITQIEALGSAVGAWTRAAVNDPENRRHAAEIRSKLEGVVGKVAASADEFTKTEVGATVAETAEKTGQAIADAGGKVADAAAPHVATALTGLAGMLGKAAERVGRAASESSDTPASETQTTDAAAGETEPSEESPDAAG